MLDEEICLLLKQISSLEIMAVLLLLLLLLLVVDLEVETSRMPLLWTHTSSNRHGKMIILVCFGSRTTQPVISKVCESKRSHSFSEDMVDGYQQQMGANG